MKIACVLGSPRKNGNTATLAKRFLEIAGGLGAASETFVLNELSYKGCQACYACKTRAEACVVEDALTGVLEAVREADVLVMASPVYFGDVSSQMKAFIDRTYAFLRPDYLTGPNPSRLAPGKQSVTILCQGNPEEGRFGDVFPRYEFFLSWYGYGPNHLIRGCGLREPGEVKRRQDLMTRAEDVARTVMGRGSGKG